MDMLTFYKALVAFGDGLLKVFNCLLAAFVIITVFPEKIFHAELTKVCVEYFFAAYFLCGSVCLTFKYLMLFKKASVTDDNFSFSKTDRIVKNLLKVSCVLAGVSCSFSLSTLILVIIVRFSYTPEIPALCLQAGCSTILYFAFMFIFMLTATAIIAYAWHRKLFHVLLLKYGNEPKDIWHALLFLTNIGLQYMYIVIYFQINFFEAKETLELYEHCKHKVIEFEGNITCLFLDSYSANVQQSLFWYNLSMNANFAIAVEVVGLLFVCHLESSYHQETEEQGNKEETEEKTEKKNKTYQNLEYLCSVGIGDRILFAFGWIPVTCAIALIGIAIACAFVFNIKLIDQTQYEYLPDNPHLWTLLIYLLTFAIYEVFVAFKLQVWHSLNNSSISPCLDIKLLRWSMISLILFDCLLIAAHSTGGVTRATVAPSISCYSIVMLEIWCQYTILYHLTGVINSGELPANQQPFKIWYYILPIMIANFFQWIYDVWLWKNVTMLQLPECKHDDNDDYDDPITVWALIEGLLFLPAIFYRFHCAFLCLMFYVHTMCKRRNVRTGTGTGTGATSGYNEQVDTAASVSPTDAKGGQAESTDTKALSDESISEDQTNLSSQPIESK